MALVTRNWWALLIRGIAAVLFGIAALAIPGLALIVLVALFGAYALIDGVFAVVAAFRHFGRGGAFWWPLLEGLAGIITGLVTFFWPAITALVLLYIIAAWSLVTGVLEIVQAFELRRVIRNEWLMILSGIASIIFGILLFAFPGAGALAVVWLIGIYAIVFGALLIGLSLRLRFGQRAGASSAHDQTMTPAF